MSAFWPETEFLRAARGKRVTVVGLGAFGGGAGAARYLARIGCRVLVTDAKPSASLGPALHSLQGLEVELVLGGHRESDFRDTDLVVASPAVPSTSPYLAFAREAGIPMTTEIRLFLAACPVQMILGITGSNGKSTTTAVAAAMLQRSGLRTWLGGNIGISLLSELSEMRESDRVVLELSSFQLEALDAAGFSPRVAVVTNLSPNHLDRHGTFDAYVRAKQTIARHQEARDVRVILRDPLVQKAFGSDFPGRVLTFGGQDHGLPGLYLDPGRGLARKRTEDGHLVDLFSLASTPLRGDFNRLNLLAAAGAALEAGATHEGMCRAVAEFTGVPHRLERVAELDGVTYFNDSVSTTPESTVASLSTFEGEQVILVAGGYDKGIDLSKLADAAAHLASGVVLIGQTASRLEDLILSALEGGGRTERPGVVVAGSLGEALGVARSQAPPGSSVLLSPGCASYDMFQNYVDRGEQFRAFVQAAAGGSS